MRKTNIKLSGTDDFFTQEAYKVLRTNLQFCGQEIKTIAITSCNENEGKTTVSLHVAKSFAELGKRVLLIDADMRKSVLVGRNTDAKNPRGLSEVLTGLARLENCIYKTQYEQLDILFAGKYPPNPVELLGSKYFTDLLAKEKEAYDYVLIDTPPLSVVIDAAVIASQCDGTVLVLGDKKVHIRQAQEVVLQLKQSKCNILGVIRNQTDTHRGGYYKGGYYKGYYKKKAYGSNNSNE